MRENINFIFTPEQQEVVAKALGCKLEGLADWEICGLLDKFIDDVCYGLLFFGEVRRPN